MGNRTTTEWKMERRVKKNCKMHAGLQIEKIREREKEDSPLTKNPAPPWQLKRNKNYPASLRERANHPVIIFVRVCG